LFLLFNDNNTCLNVVVMPSKASDASRATRRQFLTTWFDPRGGEHSVLFRRMEGRTENISPPGDNFTPRGQSSLLVDNFTHGGPSVPLGYRGEVYNGHLMCLCNF
jgi:hypothetical protein